MNDHDTNLASRLERVTSEFAELEPRERLELLLEFAENLPPLPERLQAEKDAGEHRVHECMTPTYLWVEAEDGKLQLHADVAPEAPTVKGFVGVIAEALQGVSPAEATELPLDLIQQLGLAQALGMQRMRGLSALVFRVREEAKKLANAG